jgi:hypothetical protein
MSTETKYTHPMKNRPFTTLDAKGNLTYGQVVGMVGSEFALVDFYQPAQQKLIPVRDMLPWTFYSTDLEALAAIAEGNHGAA